VLDLLIKNVRIVDGTGAPWFMGDVAVKDGRIAAMGAQVPGEARETLNGEGKVLAPGFIDIHSHSDFSLLSDASGESKLLQGVTTDIGGNCGVSPAPVVEERVDLLRKYVSFLNNSLEFNWRSFADLLKVIEEKKPALNFGALVGHGALRIAAMGFDDREPTAEEMEVMKTLMAESMEQGAFGLSSGLIYPPGCYSKTDEMVEIARVAAQYGGLYETHMRDEDDNLLDSIEESATVARLAGIPLQIAHHKVCGRLNWGKGKISQQRIEQLRVEGVDVANDQYPYNATATTITTMFPNWAHEGGVDMLLARLRDPEMRGLMRREVLETMERLDKRWEDVVIARTKRAENSRYEGLNLLEAATVAGRADDPCDFMFELVISEEGTIPMVCYAMDEEDIKAIMQSPLTMIGSDGSAVPLNRPGKPHPRTFGTFARVIRKYCLDDCLFPLEEAVRKMTSLPATRLGIMDRGMLRPSFAADMVLFDLDSIQDTATYQDPKQGPRGIEKVWVNGVLTLDQGKLTGARAGKVLRKAGA
jgi:N-acyl-D-amino-acid deacylase